MAKDPKATETPKTETPKAPAKKEVAQTGEKKSLAMEALKYGFVPLAVLALIVGIYFATRSGSPNQQAGGSYNPAITGTGVPDRKVVHRNGGPVAPSYQIVTEHPPGTAHQFRCNAATAKPANPGNAWCD